jgi:hypothetical protein
MLLKFNKSGGALILVSALATGNISNAKNYEVKFSKDTINFKGVAAVGKIKKSDKSVAISVRPCASFAYDIAKYLLKFALKCWRSYSKPTPSRLCLLFVW